MMNAVWLVILIAVGVFFLFMMLRRDEEIPREQMRRERGERSRASEIDRFLEEVNRRRREATERQQTREAPPPPPPPTEPPRPRRAARSERRKTQARQATSRAAVVEAIPVATAVAEEPEPAATVAPRRRHISSTATAAPSVALQQLQTFFRDAQSLRAAVILHEILGPPRCRRRP